MVQTLPALGHLLGQRSRPARLLLQLILNALDVFRVVFLIPAQQLQLALSLVHLLFQVTLGAPDLLRLHILLLHLARILLCEPVQTVQFLAQGLSLGCGGIQRRFQLDSIGSELLQLLQPHRDLQAPQLIPHDQVLLGLFRLLSQGLHLQLQFIDLIIDPHQVLLGALQLALRHFLSVTEFGDSRRLFKHLSPVRALHREDLVDFPLADDGVPLPAQAGVHKQLVDVPQTAGATIDVVLTLS